jgi:hypothetical protein
MHIMSVKRSLIKYPISSQYLPVTLTLVQEQNDGQPLYLVNTAPAFTLGLTQHILEELEKMRELKGLKWLPPASRADRNEMLVLETIYRRIICHGIAKEAAEEAPRLTLHQLLPFLKGASVRTNTFGSSGEYVVRWNLRNLNSLVLGAKPARGSHSSRSLEVQSFLDQSNQTCESGVTTRGEVK